MSIVRDTFELLRRLKPPSMDDNGEVEEIYRVQRYEMRVRQYRWVIFVWLLAVSLVVVADVTFSWGITGLYAGHAPRTTVDRIELRLLERDLIETRIGECRAADKRFFSERLSVLLLEYKRLAGREWRIPDCEAVAP